LESKNGDQNMSQSVRVLSALVAFLGLLSVAVAPARAQAPEARFAFVIGNDGYEGANLPTAANDAGLIAESLKQAGFDVTGARNLDQDTLRASYREFLDKVAAAGPNAVAAIYLSGYGLQVDGENYFVPVSARVQREADVSLNAVRISDLTRALGGLPGRARFVMLDVAYDGPFGKQGQPLAPGLGIVEAEPNSLIAFNAAPGVFAPKPSAGSYGPYAQALSESLHVPGLPLNDVFARTRSRVAELTKGAQIPWNDSKIDPAYALTQPAPEAPGAQPVAAEIAKLQSERAKPIRDFSDADAYSAALDRDTIAAYQDFLVAFPRSPHAKNVRGILAARREALTWRRTTAVNTPNAYWSYLRRYARGPHAGDARRRLNRLAAAEAPPASFAPIEYDIAPPPDDEVVYFERPIPRYYDDDAPAPRMAFMPPPPPWWAPPPPPPVTVYEDEVYFLPSPGGPPPPSYYAPPAYVVAPPVPYEYETEHRRGPGISPYVAIPAALAAGIVAGKLISNKQQRNQLGVQGLGPVAPGLNPGGPGRPPGAPGAGGPGRPPAPNGGVAQPFLPPVSAPAKAVNVNAPVNGAPVPAPAPVAPIPGRPPGLQPGVAPAPGQAATPPAPGTPAPGQAPGVGSANPNALPTNRPPAPGPAATTQPGQPPAPGTTVPGRAPAPGAPAPGQAPAGTAPAAGANPNALPGNRPAAPGQPAVTSQPAQPTPSANAPPGRGVNPTGAPAGAPIPNPLPGRSPAPTPSGVAPTQSAPPPVATPQRGPAPAGVANPAAAAQQQQEQVRQRQQQQQLQQQQDQTRQRQQQQQQLQQQQQQNQARQQQDQARQQQLQQQQRQQQLQQQQQQNQARQQQEQARQQQDQARQRQQQQLQQQQQQNQARQQQEQARQQQIQQQQRQQQQQQQQQIQQQRQQQIQQQQRAAPRPQQPQRAPAPAANPNCGHPGQPPCR
jgi:uncharacterized caspase-like protein